MTNKTNENSIQTNVQEEPLQIKKNMQIYMSNKFPQECRWNLKMNYTGKLICTFLGLIDYEKDEDFVIRRISGKEIAQYIGIKKNSWKDVLGKIADDARKGSIFLKKPNGGWRATGWVFYCDYDPVTDNLEFCLDGKLKPFFLKVLNAVKNLTDNTQNNPNIGYYKLEIQNLFKENGYNLIFMIIAERYSTCGGKEYTIEEFCNEFNLPKSYKIFGDLKRRILIPSINALNNTSEKYNMELITDRPGYVQRKKIIKFYLKVTHKTPKKVAKCLQPKEIPATITKPEEILLQRLSQYHINKKIAQQLIDKKAPGFLNQCIDKLETEIRNNKINKNPAGYLMTIIENSEAQYQAEQEKIKAQAQAEAELLEQKAKQEAEEKITQEKMLAAKAEHDSIIDRMVSIMNESQKERVIELVKLQNPTMYKALQKYSFDEAITKFQFRGTLSSIIETHFTEQGLIMGGYELVENTIKPQK